MDTPKSKIFLSYAHEDIGMAKRIYEDLKRFGLDVWIDYENLLPGQLWKTTIEKTIKGSQYYLLLLSTYSVTKRGFIQKEMRIAYEVLEQCSENDIYIIPVRLDECEPPIKIGEINWIDLFPIDENYQTGIRKILNVVNPSCILLRSEPVKLTHGKATAMILQYGFFDKERNDSKRFQNKYKLINDGQIVYDKATGLMWQRSGSKKELTFNDAEKYINNLNLEKFADYDDWRLPTLEEAMSLMEPNINNDAYINPLFDNKQLRIWTSDRLSDLNLPVGWVVCFFTGSYSGTGFNDFVRAVCSIQSPV